MADAQERPRERQANSGERRKHSGDRQGHSGVRQGHSGDRQGHSRDRQNHSGDRKGHSRDRQGHSGDRQNLSGERAGDKGRRGQQQDGHYPDSGQDRNYKQRQNDRGDIHGRQNDRGGFRGRGRGFGSPSCYNMANGGSQDGHYRGRGNWIPGRGRGRGVTYPNYIMPDGKSQAGYYNEGDNQFQGNFQQAGPWNLQSDMRNQTMQQLNFQRNPYSYTGRGQGYGNQPYDWRNQNTHAQYYQDQANDNPSTDNQYQRRRQRDEDDTVFLSKTLSYILRHGAEKQGFQLMKGGFLYVDEILQYTQKLHGFTTQDVERVVKDNDKQRFATEKDASGRLKIRANQGHTIEIEDLDLEEITSAEKFPQVIHGTYYNSWEVIKKTGLSRMTRNHVHFAAGEPGESGVISGMRKTCDVLIFIDMEKALKDGLKFYRSANNVILCAGDENGIIYPCYFSNAVMRQPRKCQHIAQTTMHEPKADAGQKLEFDNTINKDTAQHEPKADAGKYKRKQKDKPAYTPVGLPEQEGGKRKKKKKKKNKDKEHKEQETEPDDGTVEEDTKSAAKKQATEDHKDIPDSWDNDDDTSLGVLYEDGDTTHHEGCETSSQANSQVNCPEHTEKDCDTDSNQFHEETDETVKEDIGTDCIEDNAAAEKHKDDEGTVQNNFEEDDGQKLEFDNTINKDTKADAGKYKRKQQQTEKPAHTPVGLPEQEGGKRKKKKKWKNEDKEHNKQETEPGYGTVEEDTKPAINKQATEDQKDIPDSWDNDDNGSLGVLHGDDDTTHHEGCETGSQVDSQVNCAEHTEKDCDIDSNHFHEETDETVKVDIGTDYIEEHAAAEEQKNDERTVQNNFEVDDEKDCDIDSNHFHEETDETVKVDIGTDYIEEHAAAEEQKNDEGTVQNNFEVDDGQKLEFDNTINKDIVQHEPRADAGKYIRNQKEKPAHTLVGLPELEGGKKKKKKRKKDKEHNEQDTESGDSTVEEDTKLAAKTQATEDHIDILDSWENGDNGSLGVLYSDDDTTHHEGCETGSQADSQSSTEVTVNKDKPKCLSSTFRPCKSKPTLEDVYQKQLEVLAVQLINKQLETKKLQLQIKLLERLDKEKEETTGQEMLNAILFQ